ncbi:hypothetical protein [Ornithobacterium rhinotracheale]|uniref:hypothetical protein n=1 Tax=Ornithobacterium rhinotracheale TaxID=28251 RepID=UPI001FF33D36|nr:hypothetical protein [Ornithobacterium rhinotracheale]MCK0205413.1 hypothetical protein [Ornithobacterium rhinotracheale]
MKKFLLFLMTSVALVSCSSDDDSGKITKRCEFSTTYSNFYDNQNIAYIANQGRLTQSAGENTVFEIKTVPPACPIKTISGREIEKENKTYRILFQVPNGSSQFNWSGENLVANASPILEISDENNRVIGVYFMNEPSNFIRATKKGNKWNVSYSLEYKSANLSYKLENTNQVFTQSKH